VLAGRLFGHRYLYPIQRFVISNLLERREQIVTLPTGAGKSLCFQLASQLLPGVTVVIVPLLALLEDQLRQCLDAGLPAAALRGGQSPAQRSRLAGRIADGTVRLVYATPEALAGERAAAVLEGTPVAALVVDEAHCIAEWGPSFRPAYRCLGSLADRLAAATRAAFTATAGQRVLEVIRRELFAGREVSLVAADPDRPNLRYRVLPVLSRDRALELLVRDSPRPLVVFCRSRSGAERSARELRRRLSDDRIYFYHAGLDSSERKAVERWFLGSRDGVLTATSAYGMGVDKADIRTVVHRDPPLSPEAYLQEVGRAGRDGAPVEATLLVCEEDRRYAAALTDPVERGRFAQMLRYGGEWRRCRRQVLLGFLGQSVGFCTGCDVCDEGWETAPQPGGRAQILATVRHHGRSLTMRELTLLLCGASRHETVPRGLERMAGFGALGNWRPEDVETALDMLHLSGELRLLRRGPWRGRVTVPSRVC
jgi:ATP-dependent DNA helicase RecQ